MSVSTKSSPQNVSASKSGIFDGLFRQNIVMMTGLMVSPVAVAATTLKNALVISLAFVVITLISIVISSYIPKRIVYTIRIIIYALIATVVYIPVALFIRDFFGDVFEAIGVYIAVIVANPLILSKTESRFYKRPFLFMFVDSLMFVLGFVVVCVSVGAVREILVYNTIYGVALTFPFTVPACGTTFGGFIMIGILAGMCRAIYNYRTKRNGSVSSSDELSEE